MEESGDLSWRERMPRVRSRAVLLVVMASLIPWACTLPQSEKTDADWFRGETVRIIVGFSAGGGYDLVARLTAPHLARHIPGNPNVVVENMPGASGLIATNYLGRQARPDALTIGFIGEYATVAQLLDDPGAQYDLHDFRAIGAPVGDDPDVCIMSRASGIDLTVWQRARVPPRLGVTGRRTANHARTVLLATALNLPVRTVIGYQGQADVRMAVESGEVDGTCMALSALQTSVDPKVYQPVIQAGNDRLHLLAGVASAGDLVKDARGRQLLDLLSALRSLVRFYVVPPGTPSARVDILREAFDATMRDPAFLQAAAAVRLDVRPISAADVESRLKAVLDLPIDQRQQVSSLLDDQKAR